MKFLKLHQKYYYAINVLDSLCDQIALLFKINAHIIASLVLVKFCTAHDTEVMQSVLIDGVREHGIWYASAIGNT